MYISDFRHFLDENGNIAKEMTKKGREFAYFIALIIDATTDYESELAYEETLVRCNTKGCTGTIQSEILFEPADTIHYWCSVCNNEGLISGWEGSKWDYGRIV